MEIQFIPYSQIVKEITQIKKWLNEDCAIFVMEGRKVIFKISRNDLTVGDQEIITSKLDLPPERPMQKQRPPRSVPTFEQWSKSPSLETFNEDERKALYTKKYPGAE